MNLNEYKELAKLREDIKFIKIITGVLIGLVTGLLLKIYNVTI